MLMTLLIVKLKSCILKNFEFDKLYIYFSFFLSITIPANPTLYYIDSLYESGDYKNSAKILNELYNEDKNNIDIVYRLARSIF